MDKTFNNYNISLSILIFLTIISILTNRFLYADGSAFFYNLYFHHGFNAFDEARIFAQYLTQFPTVLPQQYLGIESKSHLMLIYGATLYSIPILSLLSSYSLLEQKKLFIFPLASFIFGSIYSYSFIISEAHTMASFFWPIIILLLRYKNKVIHNILLFILLIISTHLYESYLLFSILFAVVIIRNIKNTSNLHGKILWFGYFAIVLYGFILSFESYLHPRDPANAGAFTKSVLHILETGQNFWIIIVLFLVIVFSKIKFNSWYSLLLLSITFIIMFKYPQYLEIEKSYPGRILLTIVPFTLGILFLHETIFKSQWINNKYNKRISIALNYVVIFFLGLQLAISFQWYGYVNIFRTVLQNPYENSVIDYRETSLGKKFLGNQLINGFGWGWTYPFMSYALSDNQILTIIENKEQHCCMPNPHSLITKIQKNKTISFNNKLVVFQGWSSPETKHRWSLNKNSKIEFNLDNISDIKGVLNLNIGTLGKQEIKLTINNHYIGSQTVNGNDLNITFQFDPKILNTKGINTIEFEFSNAHKPGNGDQRVLAMALKSFSIE